MSLFQDWSVRGGWDFRNETYKKGELYPSFYTDLRKLLTVLIDSRLFLPDTIDNTYSLKYTNIDELMVAVKTYDSDLGQRSEIRFQGSTIVYTEKGEEVYNNVFHVVMRIWEQCIIISITKDVFLPMAFDNDSPTLFEWNLERYYLNKNRLKDMLDRLNSVLGWSSNSLGEIDNNKRGCMQYGHSLFLSEDFMRIKCESNPNPNFNLEQYIQEMKEAEAAARAYQKD